jgi:hypothetical protein
MAILSLLQHFMILKRVVVVSVVRAISTHSEVAIRIECIFDYIQHVDV